MAVDTSVIVRISPPRGRGDAVRLVVGGDDGVVADEVVTLDVPSLAGATPDILAGDLVAARSPAVDALLARLREAVHAPLLLDIRHPALQAAPWETLTTVPPFADGWSGWQTHRPVVRYSPRLDDRALMPVTMPVDVLVLGLGPWAGTRPDPVAEPLRHFRAVQATRVDLHRARALVRASPYEIVHVRTTIHRNGSGGGAGRRSPEAEVPAVHALHAILAAQRPMATRLVIVETDAVSMPAGYELGHRLAGRSGPTVVVADTREFDFPDFYYTITHDQVLSSAFWAASRAPTNALLMARGGDEVLLLSRAEVAVRARAEEELQRAQAALTTLAEWRSVTAWSSAARSAEATCGASAAAIEGVRQLVFTYDRESAGMEPMNDATARLNAAESDMLKVQAVTRRVVNVWFDDGEQTVPAVHALASGTEYRLLVNIGVPSSSSVVDDPLGLPEEDLAPYYELGGLPLRVTLFSTDFTCPSSEQLLVLPEPPAESEPVAFPVVTPASAGDAWLRVAIYHENNLLQSLLVTAAVSHGESLDRRGQRAVVEWALSTSLRDLGRFGPKTVNILVNRTPRGTHLLDVVGTGFSQQLEIDPTEIGTKIKEARAALQWVSGNPGRGEPYRFDADNRGDRGAFREHMSGLAELGYDLYVDLVLSHGAEFERRMQELVARPAVIQVASMRSAKLVYPWAVVFDHPVIPHRTNRLCPDFDASLAAAATGTALADHPCITHGCPHRDDTNVICPSGFWGFRHVIEQPLSSAESAARGRSPTADAVDTIAVPAGQPVEMLNGYSRDLRFHAEHRVEVQDIPGVRADADSDLLRIGYSLQRLDLDIVYFYCHGGNRRGKAWLGLGGKPPDELYASNLKAWNVQWPTRHPLVVINGCETVGISPDDLLPFTQMLAWSRAAGVLGTEIAIPEILGRAVGRQFLERFVGGGRVGEVMRQIRFDLLAGYNPLGLAYTPYSLANLRISSD